MSGMPGMTPTSLAAAVAPRTGKFIVRIKAVEKRTFLKGAWYLKG